MFVLTRGLIPTSSPTSLEFYVRIRPSSRRKKSFLSIYDNKRFLFLELLLTLFLSIRFFSFLLNELFDVLKGRQVYFFTEAEAALFCPCLIDKVQLQIVLFIKSPLKKELTKAHKRIKYIVSEVESILPYIRESPRSILGCWIGFYKPY